MSHPEGVYVISFFPDVTSHSPLTEFICLRCQLCLSLLTVPRLTETKAAPLAKAPLSRVSFWYHCRRKCRSPSRFLCVKSLRFTILRTTQPVEICGESDWKVFFRYCKHQGPDSRRVFVGFKHRNRFILY
jgi:hypothetical protein